MLNLEF